MSGVSCCCLLLALLALGASPVRAQRDDRGVRWDVDCYGNPETIRVTNQLDRPITVALVRSEYARGRDEAFERDDRLAPGGAITYYAGPRAPAGPTTLSRDFLFANRVQAEQLSLGFSPDSRLLGISDIGCPVGQGGYRPYQGAYRLHSFKLTVRGEPMRNSTFAVYPSDGEGPAVSELVLCGRGAPKPNPSRCAGNGATYYVTTASRPGNRVTYRFIRFSGAP